MDSTTFVGGHKTNLCFTGVICDFTASEFATSGFFLHQPCYNSIEKYVLFFSKLCVPLRNRIPSECKYLLLHTFFFTMIFFVCSGQHK